jgi:predicted nucleotidyltransferase
MTDYLFRRLPRSIQGRLEELSSALEAAAGGLLRSVVVHGSAARGEWREGESDLDVIVVLERSSRDVLEKMTAPLGIARAAARVEAMVLVEAEIGRAADVFPLLYDDLRRHHVVLYGRDPFADLVIHRDHLRLRVEQELREIAIRLRRGVIDAGGHPQTLAAVVTRKVRQARFPLRALLDLMGTPCSDDLEAVLAKSGRRFQVDTTVLVKSKERPHDAIDALEELLAKAVRAVDTLDVGASS